MDIKTILTHRDRSATMMRACFDEFKDDLSFWAGDQWDGSEAAREDMGRQSIAFNNMPALVHPVVNAVKQAPPAIRIMPLSGGAKQEHAALIASRIRMLERDCKASRARLYALNMACIGGIGVFRSVPKIIRGRTKTVTEMIMDPTCVLPDANSQEVDFSDARHVLHLRKVMVSALVRAFPESDFAQKHAAESARDDRLVDIIEYWYINNEGVARCTATETELIGEEQFLLQRLPYSWVTGDYYQDAEGIRHYTSLVRFARPDQVALNYATNEWISDIANTPKTDFIGEADSIEGYEEEWATANQQARAILRVKRIDKIQPYSPADRSSRYASFAADHKASMTAITGVAPQTGAVLDPVSGKSVKLQQSQAAVSTYHYVDALNWAIENDGLIYLDQMRVYENDDSVRPILGEDGQTVRRVSFGPDLVDDVENVDLGEGDYGVSVSVGPSYGSQLEAINDQIVDLCKQVPQLAGVLLPLILRRTAIPESEDVIQVLMTMLPPQVQQLMASKGDKAAQVAQLTSQMQQMQAQMQQLSQMNQQLQAQLGQASQNLQSRANDKMIESQTKLAIEQQRSQVDLAGISADLQREAMRQHGALELQRARTNDAVLIENMKSLADYVQPGNYPPVSPVLSNPFTQG